MILTVTLNPAIYKMIEPFFYFKLPKKEYAIPRLIKLARQSREMFGSREEWRENFGRYKGF